MFGVRVMWWLGVCGLLRWFRVFVGIGALTGLIEV